MLPENVSWTNVTVPPPFAIPPPIDDAHPLPTIVAFVSDRFPPSTYAAPPSKALEPLFSNVTPTPVTFPAPTNNPPPPAALLPVNETSVRVKFPKRLLIAPPSGVFWPLFANATLSTVTVPPSLNSAPPPLALIVSHGLQNWKASSLPSTPLVIDRPWISTVPPSIRRIRTSPLPEPSITVASTPLPAIVRLLVISTS